MAWSRKISEILTDSVGGESVLGLFPSPVRDYLKKYELNTVSDPFLISEVYAETSGFQIFEDQSFRKSVLSSLSDIEVNALAAKLNIPNANDIRTYIANVVWNWDSQFAEIFCAHFDCSDVVIEARKFIEAETGAERIVSTIGSINYRFFELHAYQAQIKDDVIRHFEISNQQKALIQLPTGAGKTRLGIHTAIRYISKQNSRKHILWLAYQPLLLKQALETFEELWPILGDGEISVGQCYAGINTLYLGSERSITFANVPVMLDRYAANKTELNEKLSLIVFDEAHQSIADNARRLLSSLTRNEEVKLIGLTATPGRSAVDPLENVKLVQFFDNNKFEITPPASISFIGSEADLTSDEKKRKTPIRWLQEQGVLANLEHEVISVEKKELIQSNGDEIFKGDVLKIIERDIERNKKIIDKLIELNQKEMKVLVFACSIEHSKNIVSLLRFKGVNAGLVIGENINTRDSVLRKFTETKEINIIVNYGVLTTGFDAPILDALLVARPTSSVVTYSQMLGRALRGVMNGGHQTNYIFNVDTPFYGDEVDAYNYFSDYWS